MSESRSLGEMGEDLAAEHLVSRGYKILHRNWRTGKKEIDIVAEDGECIVFAEVKTRSWDMQLHPGELITYDKQRMLIYAAENYIKKYNINKESRFDVVIIIIKDKNFEVDHREGAFYPTLR
jgi:putative endonuclease